MAIGFTDISNLVVFGDSLSDNGNLFKDFGISLPFSWEGRASNGPVYVEQLAQLLGVQLDDHAFAGAEASDLSPPVLPVSLPINLPEQVAGYLTQLDGHTPRPVQRRSSILAPTTMQAISRPFLKASLYPMLRASWRVSLEVSSNKLMR